MSMVSLVRKIVDAAGRFGVVRSLLLLGLLSVGTLLVFLPDAASAAAASTPVEGKSLSDALCTVTDQLTGPIGRGIAIIALVFLGISLFLGKVSWGLALAVGLGITTIFGADKIIKLMAGDVSNDCGTTTSST